MDVMQLCLCMDIKMSKASKIVTGLEVKANCKYCKNSDGSYKNYLTHCNVLNLKRPYGIRECSDFKRDKFK